MFNLENWAWADCQLGNIAKRAQQFNLYGEKREWRKEREEKERKKGEGREKSKGRGVWEGKIKRKKKNRKEKVNRHMWKRFIYIQE